MNFPEVDQRYATLKQEYQAGRLSADAFDEQLKSMMVQDSQGRWWAKSREKGEWHYYDLTTTSWQRADPPVTPVAPTPNRAAPSQQTATFQSSSSPAAASQSTQAQPARTQPVAQAGAPGPKASELALQGSAPAGVAPQTAGAPSTANTRSSSWTISSQPELGAGLKFFYYFIVFMVPIAGIVLFLVYRGKAVPEDRAAARLCLILGVVSLLLFCSCSSLGLLGYIGSAGA